MKKLLLGIGVLPMLVGCVTPSMTSLTPKGEVDQGNISINPKSDVGYVGDPMPFFDNGKMNVFYLQDGRNTSLGFHPVSMMDTTNFYDYNEHGVVLPYENDIYSPDLAIGTGSVIKDKNGIYHFFYTGFNGNSSSGLPYKEKIQHATSNDMINWTKIEDDGFYGGKNDFRDPYVIYNTQDDCYWMLITTNSGGHGIIELYKSEDLKTWSYSEEFYRNPFDSSNMECPTLIEFGGYWYLSFSTQGSPRTTKYVYKKNLTDATWKVPSVPDFDGIGFYAGRMEKGFDRLFVFGWNATKEGSIDYGQMAWGGHLVVHELIQNTDGTLSPSVVKDIDEKLSNEVGYNFIDNSNGVSFESIDFNNVSGNNVVVEEVSKNVTKINFNFIPGSINDDAGLTFNATIQSMLGVSALNFNVKENLLSFHNNTLDGSLGTAESEVVCKYESTNNVTILIDDDVMSVYVNDNTVLTTKVYALSKDFALYSKMNVAKFNEVKFYE